ncbi:membrane protein insertase YidC [Actinoallomurus purpureus]|uniref:membrane protein insertase YidC n=1 Tax=Actinoallomurus purpureus TaxID=478114 RepID=UPI002092F11D|nr:membrane protein insertase YidC [Actinoallomurus purpureus]MCO6007306.1 membrane protein insertase YidC [Actinoallomurus purpureus]
MSLSFLDPLFEAVAWVIVQIHAGLSLIFPADSGWAWGLSIFLLTVLMRLILFPLFVKQIHASRKMQELQPQVQALRKKYKKDKQRLNQEMMKLYQEAGANPLSGCLPLVVQFPIFISLYNVLRAISTTPKGHSKFGISADLIQSAQNADIFGAHIPSTFKDAFSSGLVGAMVVTGLAVAISSTTTFFTMKSSVGRSMQTMTADNPMMQSQKFLVYLSPLFGLFGLTLPLGVLIYWVTTNSWTLAQSHYVYKKYPTNVPDAEGNGAAGAKTGAKPATGAKTGTAKAGTAKTTTRAAKNGAAKPAAGNALVGKGKKSAEVEADEPVDDTSSKVARQQPTRQSRSKRKR